MDKIYKEIHDYRLRLAIEGPPILIDSPNLIKAVEDYRKEELRKEYGYGNYQDKNLSKTKEMNISPELNVKKEAQPTLGIEEYLKGLREGVGI
ncbi:DNA replication protein [Fusobacterium nucleatum]|uniref:DNA replication protein n=1 Tax=Fusobacterium nucleatum subsp. polymorphum TaxID=76857 RepID=A0A2C6AVK1_FUSNP|nr:DNA replication protein [Fusobacterium polymorphum]PHH96346.1 DNA replication protein [Fusobacterium polymorphum]